MAKMAIASVELGCFEEISLPYFPSNLYFLGPKISKGRRIQKRTSLDTAGDYNGWKAANFLNPWCCNSDEKYASKSSCEEATVWALSIGIYLFIGSYYKNNIYLTMPS